MKSNDFFTWLGAKRTEWQELEERIRKNKPKIPPTYDLPELKDPDWPNGYY